VCRSCFLPLDARSAKGGIAIVSRPSVCLSVCSCNVEVPWSYGLGYFECKYHTWSISLQSWLLWVSTSAIYSIGNTPKIWVEKEWGLSSQQKTNNISETEQIWTKVITDDQQQVAYALSIGTKIYEGWPRTANMHCVSKCMHSRCPPQKLNEDRPRL